VERNAYDGGAKKWIRVTNAEFPRLVRGDLMTDMPGYRGWNQLYFFEVAKSGFNVTRYT